jgi:Putative DNA-binding domain
MNLLRLQQWELSLMQAVTSKPKGVRDLKVVGAIERERLDIYRTAYFERLASSLRDDFRVTQQVISIQAFAALLRQFIFGSGSTSRSLADTSFDFAHFAFSTPIAEATRRAFKSDLLALEASWFEHAQAPKKGHLVFGQKTLVEFDARSVWLIDCAGSLRLPARTFSLLKHLQRGTTPLRCAKLAARHHISAPSLVTLFSALTERGLLLRP